MNSDDDAYYDYLLLSLFVIAVILVHLFVSAVLVMLLLLMLLLLLLLAYSYLRWLLRCPVLGDMLVIDYYYHISVVCLFPCCLPAGCCHHLLFCFALRCFTVLPNTIKLSCRLLSLLMVVFWKVEVEVSLTCLIYCWSFAVVLILFWSAASKK